MTSKSPQNATIAWLLFLVGLLASTVLAARYVSSSGAGPRLAEWGSQSGGAFLGAWTLMLAGAYLVRRASHNAISRSKAPPAEQLTEAQDTKTQGTEASRSQTPLAAMQSMLNTLQEARNQLVALPASARQPLDQLLENQIPEFLEHRHDLQEQLGLLHFAQLMGDFASFERNTARAWSAMTDSVEAEASRALSRAEAALVGAIAKLSTVVELNGEPPNNAG